MSHAIQELQQTIANRSYSLTKLLQQTKVVAAKLNSGEVESWVTFELEGYAETVEPPAYRRILTDCLEVYNERQDSWQFAGHLNFTFQVRQPLAQIEEFIHKDRLDFPVARNFAIKNDFGDSFATDWPQRFIVKGSKYRSILEAVTARWAEELEKRGITIRDLPRFIDTMKNLSDSR